MPSPGKPLGISTFFFQEMVANSRAYPDTVHTAHWRVSRRECFKAATTQTNNYYEKHEENFPFSKNGVVKESVKRHEPNTARSAYRQLSSTVITSGQTGKTFIYFHKEFEQVQSEWSRLIRGVASAGFHWFCPPPPSNYFILFYFFWPHKKWAMIMAIISRGKKTEPPFAGWDLAFEEKEKSNFRRHFKNAISVVIDNVTRMRQGTVQW